MTARREWHQLRPSDVACPTCEAPAGQPCMTLDPRVRVWVVNPLFHIDREAKYTQTGAPLQLSIPVDGATL